MTDTNARYVNFDDTEELFFLSFPLAPSSFGKTPLSIYFVA